VFKGIWERQKVAIALKKIFLASSTEAQQQTRAAFRKECKVRGSYSSNHIRAIIFEQLY
jgi:hypothetical protein